MGGSGYCLASCIQMNWFYEVCRRRGLSEGQCRKSKVMVLNGEEGLECKVHVDGIHLEHVSEFKYLGCVLAESGTQEAEGSEWEEGCRCYQVPS